MKKFLLVLSIVVCCNTLVWADAAPQVYTAPSMNESGPNACDGIMDKCQAAVKAGSIPPTMQGQDTCTLMQAKCKDTQANPPPAAPAQ